MRNECQTAACRMVFSGAVAAKVAAGKAMGAGKEYLLQYTTSYDVMPEGVFAMAVGYAGILF